MKIKSLLKILILSTISLLLYSCASVQNNATARSPYNQDPNYYLNQASNSQGDQQQTYALQAVAAYFYQGEFNRGRTILYSMPYRSLNDINAVQYQLLSARLAQYDKKTERSIAILNGLVENPNLSSQMEVEALKLRAKAQKTLRLPIASIKSLILITPLLTNDNDKITNQQHIWQQLSKLPTKNLIQLANDNSDPTLQGWASLTLIVRQYATQPGTFISQLEQWQQQFSNHPASNLVSTDVSQIYINQQPPAQVAVLLPLKSNIGAQAQAILNGFMAAYYQSQQQGLPAAKIKVYDTSNASITDVYQKAVQDGAQFIIGPLSKTNVNTLIQDGNVNVPTLALNFSTDGSLPDKAFEYALSPQQEAETVADRAAKLGYVNAVVISPKNNWGQSIAQTLIQRWQNDGGTIIKNVAFMPNKNLRPAISALLNINQSYQRRTALSNLIGQPVKFSPRRRHDIDVIFINALPQDARQILPLLRFYYAGNIPIFATSQLYNGTPNPTKDTDLNDVRFTIMPWAINPSAQAIQLRNNIKKLWPQNFDRFSLFYAFGIDAFNIMSHLEQLRVLPNLGYLGNTGTLYLAKDHKISRTTQWAEFVNGKPKQISFESSVIIPLETNDQ